MSTAVAVPDVTTVEQTALDLVGQCRALKVSTAESYTRAAKLLQAIKQMRNEEVNTIFDPIIASAHAAHKTALAGKKKIDEPLANAELYLRCQVTAYTQEQERIRRAEEARLQEEARKDAEATAKQAAEDEQVRAALEAEQSGDTKAAEQIISAPVQAQPVFVPPVVVPRTVPTVAGLSTRKVWKFRVVDETKIPREFLMVDESKLRKFAGAMQEQAKVEGVEFYAEDSAVVR